MALPTVPMTPEGHQRLREEIKQLKEVERPQIVREIAAAREHGDLSENAEYHAAREKQGLVEARIAIVDDALARAEVIDASKIGSDKVAFGAYVRLANVDTGDEITYRIVGPMEADFGAGSISISSPIARGLIGKRMGDEVTIQTPGGAKSYEVLDVSFA